MARKAMIVALSEEVDNLRATVTLARAGLRWTSTGGEWLGATEGVWVEVAGTISLKDAAGNVVVAVPFACSFDTSGVGDNGRANYTLAGRNGRWLVTTVT